MAVKKETIKVESIDDNWAHRSDEMRCQTCMWYVEKIKKTTKAGDDVEIGRCRRRAPTMNGYPVVYSDDWCGDHKLNENAL